MKRVVIILLSLLILVISGWIMYSKINNKPVHSSISNKEVSEITIYGTSGTRKLEDDAMVENIIKWFNQASDIRINKDFAGTTPESGIIIKLKSGRRVSILNSGSDFEIQRDDTRNENISYWARQHDIKRYLGELVRAFDTSTGFKTDKF